MKKILFIINGFQLFHNDLKYAIHIAEKEKAVLHALFVHNLNPQEVEGYAFPSDINLTAKNFNIESERAELVKLQSAQVKLFEDICSSGRVSFKSQLIHEDFLDAIIDNSAFADLMIINADVDIKSPKAWHISAKM